MAQHIYLITGANRGIGRAMAATLLLRPSTTIVATVRDPSTTAAQSLLALPTGPNSKLLVLRLDNRSGFEDFQTSLASSSADIPHLDTVIANAGNSESFVSVMDTKPENLRDDFEVNVVGTFRLFQTVWPLLVKSPLKMEKKFVYITSSVGSIAGLAQENMPGVSYGASKAAANWVVKKLSVEYAKEGLQVGIIHPGWVKTGMGQALADVVGFPEPPMTIEQSTEGVLKQIDALSPETSGKFLMFDGQEMPW